MSRLAFVISGLLAACLAMSCARSQPAATSTGSHSPADDATATDDNGRANPNQASADQDRRLKLHFVPTTPAVKLREACTGTHIDLQALAETNRCPPSSQARYAPFGPEIEISIEPDPLVVIPGEDTEIDYVIRNRGARPRTIVLPQLACLIGELGAVFVPEGRDSGYSTEHPCSGGGCGSRSVQVTLDPGDDARIRWPLTASGHDQAREDCPDRERLPVGSYRYTVSLADPPRPDDVLPAVTADLRVVAE